jgi:hypothetical protein
MTEMTFGIGSRINHSEFGAGVVIQVKTNTYIITFFEHGIKEIAKTFEGIEIIDAVEPIEDLVSHEEIETGLIKILRKFADIQETVPIAEKWRGGRIIMQPGNTNLKGYEMPINTFFHKIVMVRDRLRVMEQRINNSKLTDDEKVNLQQYISRIYGSLTSFNIFFKDQNHKFVGSR